MPIRLKQWWVIFGSWYPFRKPPKSLIWILESSHYGKFVHYSFRLPTHCIFETPLIQIVALFISQDQRFRDLKLPINIQVCDGVNYNVLPLGQMLWKIGILFTSLEWWTVTSLEKKQFCRIYVSGFLPIMLKIMAFEKETCVIDGGGHFGAWKDLRNHFNQHLYAVDQNRKGQKYKWLFQGSRVNRGSANCGQWARWRFFW